MDLRPRHVAKANADLGGLGVVAELGDARKLTAANASYDVVLVFRAALPPHRTRRPPDGTCARQPG